MAAPVREILDGLPGIPLVPHVYMNKEVTRPHRRLAGRAASRLAAGDRLMPVVLAVIYDNDLKGDQATDWGACAAVWRQADWGDRWNGGGTGIPTKAAGVGELTSNIDNTEPQNNE